MCSLKVRRDVLAGVQSILNWTEPDAAKDAFEFDLTVRVDAELAELGVRFPGWAIRSRVVAGDKMLLGDSKASG